MNHKFLKYKSIARLLVLFLLLLILLIDINVSLGVAVGVLYVFPLYILFGYKESKLLITTSIVSVLLISTGFILSPPKGDEYFTIVIANRIISIFIVLISTGILNRNITLDLKSKQNDLRFKLLYRKSIVAMATTDLKTGDILNINQAAIKLFGYKNKHEAISTFKSENHYEDEEDRNKVLSILDEKKEVKDFLAKLRRLDGTTIWVEISAKVFEHEGVIEGVFYNVTEKVKAKHLLEKTLKEKDVLLNEIHHRVKNNLQIIWGMLDLQQSKSTNAIVKSSLEDSKIRIRTIGLLHENLYNASDYININFSKYIQNLIVYLNSIYYRKDKRISVINKVENINCDFEISIPLSLIVSEILSNAYKHAFVDKKTGIININGDKINDTSYVIIIADNGVGYDVNKVFTSSIGMRLIKSLADQVDAELEVFSEISKGTTYKLTINE